MQLPEGSLRAALDRIAAALGSVGDAGEQARKVVDELRSALRETAVQSVKSARSLAKFDEINRLSAPAAEKAAQEQRQAAETAAKACDARSPLDVQTGPAVRNDFATKARHGDLLSFDLRLKNIYSTISQSIWETSKKI